MLPRDAQRGRTVGPRCDCSNRSADLLGQWALRAHARSLSDRISMVIRRATNICAALVIVVLTVLAGAGGASSAVPSPIDPAMLPEDGPPAPPQPTEQRTLCVPAVAGGAGADRKSVV